MQEDSVSTIVIARADVIMEKVRDRFNNEDGTFRLEDFRWERDHVILHELLLYLDEKSRPV